MEFEKVSFTAPSDVLLSKSILLELFRPPTFILARLTLMTREENVTLNFANEMS